MEKQIFKVMNISCNHCVNTIQMELGEMEGVSNVTASVEKKQVEVEFQLPATRERIIEMLEEINYPATA
jgi:copper ion binding protein